MKRIVFLIALGWLAISSMAQQLSEQEAKDRALQYLSAKAPAKTRGLSASQLESVKVGAEKIYAFNREGGGFVIASGDERTLPVLGYSDSGSIDWERLPENMRAWLMQYDEAIATLGSRTDFKDGCQIIAGKSHRASTRSARPAVQPLIKTRWSQDPAPYNDMIPLYAGHNPDWQGQQCLAGCNAVALAQVLNYWQWPKSLPDGLPAYESSDYKYDANLTWHIDALPPVTFDWENLITEYTPFNYSTWKYELFGTEVQQQAVATLMRYCAQAVKAYFFPTGTGSNLSRCRDALVNHFGFRAATLLITRKVFGIDEWEEMLYTELAAGRPVIYAGTSPTMGSHAFLCDGYDGEGLFHINWGWQGDGDGYFSLSVLNPYSSTNPNLGSDYLGYTQGQYMIIGLDPSLEKLDNPLNDKPELWQHRSIEVLSANTVMFYFNYYSDNAWKVSADYALGTIETDGTLTPCFIGDPNDSIVCDENNIYIEIDSMAFQPGQTLRLHPMLRFRNVPGTEWQLIPPNTICIDAGRREDGRFFITNNPYQFECAGAAITSGLGRLGVRSDITVTIRNNEQTDYIGDILLSAEGDILRNGAYLHAGQEDDVTFLFTPKHGGQVKFDLYTENEEYFDSFTMEFDSIIYDYGPYLVNNSYVTHEDNHYVYHVEVCDRPDVTVPHGVPLDSTYFFACIASDDETVFNEIWFDEEFRNYLRALPDSAGSGNYKFTGEVSLDIEQDGSYFVWSVLVGWQDVERTEEILEVEHYEEFPVTVVPTAIKGIEGSLDEPRAPFYDLQGRRLQARLPRKGIYIQRGKKVVYY